jgi:type I restriction enzyme S subunit
MANKLEVSPTQMDIVLTILSHHLPAGGVVSVFGSRAKGEAKKFSDLDLVVDMGEPMSLALLAKLSGAFEESALPYKVDIVDWQAIDQAFREHIKDDRWQIFPLS